MRRGFPFRGYVSRRWCGGLKRRVPQPIELCLKIDDKLKEYENGTVEVNHE